MAPAIERRLLQAAVAVACLVPLSTGGESVIRGATFLRGVPQPVPTISSGPVIGGRGAVSRMPGVPSGGVAIWMR